MIHWTDNIFNGFSPVVLIIGLRIILFLNNYFICAYNPPVSRWLTSTILSFFHYDYIWLFSWFETLIYYTRISWIFFELTDLHWSLIINYQVWGFIYQCRDFFNTFFCYCWELDWAVFWNTRGFCKFFNWKRVIRLIKWYWLRTYFWVDWNHWWDIYLSFLFRFYEAESLKILTFWTYLHVLIGSQVLMLESSHGFK